MPLGAVFKRLGVDGLFGDDLMTALVVEVDYENRRVRLYDKDKFRLPIPAENFSAIPLMFRKSDGLPFIKATLTPPGFNTTDALLNLDSGSAMSVSLYAPYVARHQWRESLPRTVPSVTAGVNGAATWFVARLRDLSIGQTPIHLPQVEFAVATKGAMAMDETDGQLGDKIFEQFTLIFDFANKKLYVRPNSDASKPMATNWYFGIWF